MLLIDRKEIIWRKGERNEINLVDMDDQHLVSAWLSLQERKKTLAKVKIPAHFVSTANELSGRSIDEWQEIFLAEMEYRQQLIDAKKKAEEQELRREIEEKVRREKLEEQIRKELEQE